MARAKDMPIWMKVFIAVFLVALVFLLVSLVWAAAVDMNMIDLWRSWFGIAITEPEPVGETVETLGRLIFKN